MTTADLFLLETGREASFYRRLKNLRVPLWKFKYEFECAGIFESRRSLLVPVLSSTFKYFQVLSSTFKYFQVFSNSSTFLSQRITHISTSLVVLVAHSSYARHTKIKETIRYCQSNSLCASRLALCLIIYHVSLPKKRFRCTHI